MNVDLVLVPVGVLVLYVLLCLALPFARCRGCTGSGKVRRPHGRAWHACRRCKGTGRRLRWGRHVTNYLHRTRDHAHRTTTTYTRLKTGGHR